MTGTAHALPAALLAKFFDVCGLDEIEDIGSLLAERMGKAKKYKMLGEGYTLRVSKFGVDVHKNTTSWRFCPGIITYIPVVFESFYLAWLVDGMLIPFFLSLQHVVRSSV